jgi:dTDP-4-amino-4,6-dideoxygalactose transaminase
MSLINFHSGYGYFRGRVALAALLRTLNVGTGDKILIPGYSCSALVESVFAVGAKPIYIDIKPETYNLDAEDIVRKLDGSVRAMVVQHTYGIPADMDVFSRIASEKQIPLIEDCCHTLDGLWRGKLLGTFGYGAFYSFEAGKPLTTGIGGWAHVNNEVNNEALMLDHSRCAEPAILQQLKIEMMRIFVMLLYKPGTYWQIKRVYNFLQRFGVLKKTYNKIDETEDYSQRLSRSSREEFLMRLGKTQNCALFGAVKHYVRIREQRKERSDMLLNALEKSRVSGLPRISPLAEATLLRVPVRVRDKYRTLALASERRIEISDNYISPVHPYKGKELVKVEYLPGSCPYAEAASEETVCIPVSERTTYKDIDRAVELVAAG